MTRVEKISRKSGRVLLRKYERRRVFEVVWPVSDEGAAGTGRLTLSEALDMLDEAGGFVHIMADAPVDPMSRQTLDLALRAYCSGCYLPGYDPWRAP